MCRPVAWGEGRIVAGAGRASQHCSSCSSCSSGNASSGSNTRRICQLAAAHCDVEQQQRRRQARQRRRWVRQQDQQQQQQHSQRRWNVGTHLRLHGDVKQAVGGQLVHHVIQKGDLQSKQ